MAGEEFTRCIESSARLRGANHKSQRLRMRLAASEVERVRRGSLVLGGGEFHGQILSTVGVVSGFGDREKVRGRGDAVVTKRNMGGRVLSAGDEELPPSLLRG
jgi:hypothetical protein